MANEVKKPEERRHAKKVVKGEVTVREKSLAKKFWQVFQLRDISEIQNYIYEDLIVPGFKKAIRGIVDIILDGEVRSYTGRPSNSAYRINYNQQGRERERTPARRGRVVFDELEYDSRADAQEVLNELSDIMKDYGHVKVADLYDASGVTNPRFTNFSYGWYDISGFDIRWRNDGKYVIDTPRSVVLDK